MEQITADQGYYRLKKHINDLTLISAVGAIFSPYILYLARMSSDNVAKYHISWVFVETEGNDSQDPSETGRHRAEREIVLWFQFWF